MLRKHIYIHRESINTLAEERSTDFFFLLHVWLDLCGDRGKTPQVVNVEKRHR
jgi:hypothetical protein